ncbi:MAG: hypothetical protein ACREBG_23725 [Pyrinomonadaceae bacterium]
MKAEAQNVRFDIVVAIVTASTGSCPGRTEAVRQIQRQLPRGTLLQRSGFHTIITTTLGSLLRSRPGETFNSTRQARLAIALCYFMKSGVTQLDPVFSKSATSSSNSPNILPSVGALLCSK